MYNYNPGLTADGLLPNPRQNYGGVTRAITTEVDFDRTNIEYVEFWMMDPFSASTTNSLGEPASNDDSPNSSGGFLYFNLGNISEDILRDGRTTNVTIILQERPN